MQGNFCPSYYLKISSLFLLNFQYQSLIILQTVRRISSTKLTFIDFTSRSTSSTTTLRFKHKYNTTKNLAIIKPLPTRRRYKEERKGSITWPRSTEEKSLVLVGFSSEKRSRKGRQFRDDARVSGRKISKALEWFRFLCF